jgi:Tol biopolymer transport system component
MYRQNMLGRIASLVVAGVGLFLASSAGTQARGADGARAEPDARLAAEVRTRGRIVFCARSAQGDWDLFVCRPDGSLVRNLTNTPGFHEAAPQFSRDGRRLLYRRLKREEAIDGNRYGTQGELVIARSDGTSPVALGKAGEYAWASWSPDGKQVACLSTKGVSFVDIESRHVVRALPRKGFFQQLTWSPDGHWLAGVANAFGTGWSVARMDAHSGAAYAVSRVDCCTPDWFPDSESIIFSSRPAGQEENEGNGWTQLWMASADGTSRRLIYGEDGRHVYGGHVSPDGKYVLFTGNLREDGDPQHGGAPMGLLRLADAPIIGGQSKELRKLHPGARSGPVLTLPVGWEPCWTLAESSAIPPPGSPPRATAERTRSIRDERPAEVEETAALAREVGDKGWIAFSAPGEQGDWDLFLMRPDGSRRAKIAAAREFHEAGVRFSPDGTRILYYRIPRSDPVDNNTYGTYPLVIAGAHGGNPVVLGVGFSWAAWGPDGTQLACLDPKGIRVIDIASRTVVRQLPRKGFVRQLAWSPDGNWFAATANGLGAYWNIGRMDARTGRVNPLSETDRYNCTPDWMPDSRHVVYSRGINPDAGGFAELWLASADGAARRVIYAQKNRHIYGGCPSPDGKYVLFSRSDVDLGRLDNSRTSMAIMRMPDSPNSSGPVSPAAAEQASSRRAPLLELSWGWEPHWTYAEIRPPAP